MPGLSPSVPVSARLGFWLHAMPGPPSQAAGCGQPLWITRLSPACKACRSRRRLPLSDVSVASQLAL